MSTTRIRRWLLCVGGALLLGAWLMPLGVHAESMSLKLSLHKVRGTDLLGRVAGSFRVALQAPEDVRAVTFYLDGQPVARVTSYPFVFQFDTRDFAKGQHRIAAVAHLANGSVTTSNTLSLDFRSRGWSLAVRQSMFLYAGLLVALSVTGALLLHRLLRLQPRLILLAERPPAERP